MARLGYGSPRRLALGGLVFVVAVLCGRAAGARQIASEEPPLRHAEPLATVVADLEGHIPVLMEAADVPGLAIALIRDGQVVWSEGFGITSRLMGTPVTSETIFEVASNSKPVAAYVALRLVDQGRLTLDDPLAASLETPWLPGSAVGDRITLRHVASHSSGLADNNLLPVDKAVAFEPGASFAYSGVGFLYLQEAIEQVTGSSLEDASQSLVFEPLGMESSSFVGRSDLEARTASGHISYALPLVFFLAPFIGVFLVLGFVGGVVRRIRAGTWRLSRRLMVANAIVATLAALVLVCLTLGRVVPNLALLAGLSAAVFAVVFVSAALLGRWAIARLATPPLMQRLYALWMVVVLAVLMWLSGAIQGPMPNVLSPPPSAVGSLRTTAPDLATFLAEMAAPEFLSEGIAPQVRTPQVAITADFSWGLGIGIQHSDQGDALWQNGMTPGYRSVMVVYPEYRWGVVVLTNSDDGLQVAYDVAARALGGKAYWSRF